MRAPYLLSVVSPLFLVLSGCGAPEVIDTLSGTVVDMLGTPSPGVTVALGDQVTITDGAGRFTFPMVTSPYDVTLIPPNSQDPYLFRGLSGAEPTLRLYDRLLGAQSDTQGAPVALDLPIAADGSEKVAFVVDSPDELTPIEVPIATPTAPGQIPILVRWPRGEPVTVRIQAFRYQPDESGAPLHYTGYDSTTMTLTSGMLAGGGQASWKASWKAPSFKETKVSFSVDLPSGYQIFQSQILVSQNGAKHGQGFAWSTSTATDLSFVVPDLGGGPIFVAQVCAWGGVTTSCRTQPGLTAGAESTTISVDEGPVLHSPNAGDSVGVGSEISWSAQGDGAGFVLLYPTSNVGLRYFIASADESVVLPDLAKLGTKLPAGADYSVAVFRNSATETVDDLAAQGPVFAPTGEPSTYAYSAAVKVKTR